MNHLVASFKENIGVRGAHFYSSSECKFSSWREVLEFANQLPTDKGNNSNFAERLVHILCNYNPDEEFLAINCEGGGIVAIELYGKIG